MAYSEIPFRSYLFRFVGSRDIELPSGYWTHGCSSVMATISARSKLQESPNFPAGNIGIDTNFVLAYSIAAFRSHLSCHPAPLKAGGGRISEAGEFPSNRNYPSGSLIRSMRRRPCAAGAFSNMLLIRATQLWIQEA